MHFLAKQLNLQLTEMKLPKIYKTTLEAILESAFSWKTIESRPLFRSIMFFLVL